MTKKSTYFFIGRLSDQSAKYYVNELCLENNFFLEVLLDGIVIWGNTNKSFDGLLPKVREIFDIILCAFVFKTKKPLNYSLTNWIETKEIIARKNMTGWILNPYDSRTHYPRGSKYNTAWKKAAWFYNNLSKGNNNHILALKDYRSALIDAGDDAFFFAYRSVEDICRAIIGYDDVNKNNAWKKMHKILKTGKTTIDSLTSVAEKVRHGNKNDPIVVDARKNRDKLLNIAHTIIEKELERAFPQFIK